MPPRPWPEAAPQWEDAEAERALTVLMENVSAVRNLKASLGLNAAGIPMTFIPASAQAGKDLEALRGEIRSLTRSGELHLEPALPAGVAAARGVTASATVALHISGYLDVAKERQRIGRDLERLSKELAGHEAKLADQISSRGRSPRLRRRLSEPRARLPRRCRSSSRCCISSRSEAVVAVLPPHLVARVVREALLEDLGPGDLTCATIIDSARNWPRHRSWRASRLCSPARSRHWRPSGSWTPHSRSSPHWQTARGLRPGPR